MIKTLENNSQSISQIDLNDLIYPVFVVPGQDIKDEIDDMPGIHRFSIDRLIGEVSSLKVLGVNKFLLFGVPSSKSWFGKEAYLERSLVADAVLQLKSKIENITLMTDVCLCAYTQHGHCGIIKEGKEDISNAETLEVLSKMALFHAQAGADYVAPSAMSDGQVGAIRKSLDEKGLYKTKIMGYSAKFASNFYGPFRNVADSAPAFGDRRGYQLDYRKITPALEKVDEDIKGGADIIMVKPAIGYLDVIYRVRSAFNKPLAVYNVSGEYAFVKNGVMSGMWNEQDIVSEIFSSFKRAGADLIITYHAKDIALWKK